MPWPWFLCSTDSQSSVRILRGTFSLQCETGEMGTVKLHSCQSRSCGCWDSYRGQPDVGAIVVASLHTTCSLPVVFPVLGRACLPDLFAHL